jgi:hypothetical protein
VLSYRRDAARPRRYRTAPLVSSSAATPEAASTCWSLPVSAREGGSVEGSVCGGDDAGGVVGGFVFAGGVVDGDAGGLVFAGGFVVGVSP